MLAKCANLKNARPANSRMQGDSPKSPLSALTRCFNGLLHAHDAQALSAAKLAVHQRRGGDERVVPVAEHRLHVSGYAFEHDGRGRLDRPVFLGDCEDDVFLGEHEGGGEGVVLGAGEGADDTA